MALRRRNLRHPAIVTGQKAAELQLLARITCRHRSSPKRAAVLSSKRCKVATFKGERSKEKSFKNRQKNFPPLANF